MVSDKKLANAVGGKTARACDNCIKKRARWYCPADDAFLCQSCDGSVHSANPLARRHERVRLKIASIMSSSSKETANLEISVPSWHHGFTKKARTPRHGKLAKSSRFGRNPLHLVPEVCSDENSQEENDEQLVYRVPIFDPFVAEICSASTANSNEAAVTSLGNDAVNGDDESKVVIQYESINDLNQLHGSLPSEMELAEFAADVESLLGKGLEAESFDMEGLGLSGDHKEKDLMDDSLGSGKVKVEEDEGEAAKTETATATATGNVQVDKEIDLARETFELNFDYDSPLTCEEDNKTQVDQREVILDADRTTEHFKLKIDDDVNATQKILLRLDYDGVIAAWDEQKCPWTNGERPELDLPDCMGFCGTVHSYGEAMVFGHAAIMDGGREAKVSRYREKRRTRLFSKKIRYEVRKLNAEKRPRMKGRFVKRANFSGNTFPLHSK